MKLKLLLIFLIIAVAAITSVALINHFMPSRSRSEKDASASGISAKKNGDTANNNSRNALNNGSQKNDFKFEFVSSVTNGVIFIETTENENAQSTLSGDAASTAFREKGGVIPQGKDIFEVDPKYFGSIVDNKKSDRFTLLMNGNFIQMATAGFFYNVDEGCGDDNITVKLLPKDTFPPMDFSKSQFLILKQPHPKIQNVKIITFSEAEMPKKYETMAIIHAKKSFNTFLKTAEYFVESVKTSEINFFDRPELAFYKSDSDNDLEFFAAKWHSDLGELECCVSALFRIHKYNKTVTINEVVPLTPDGIGVGHMSVDKIVEINKRTFVFINKGYWEWGHDEIYEIIPRYQYWKSYSASRTSGGC